MLSYTVLGPSHGRPLIFVHGFPSSRLEATGLTALANRKNLLVISPDRPGFGRSTYVPNRTISDYPADIDALATHLGLKRFMVLGGWGGGAFALASAAALGSERCSAVGVLAGAPPWEAGSWRMKRLNRLTAWMSEYMPGFLRGLAGALVGVARWVAKRKAVERMIDGVVQKAQEKKEKEKRAIADRSKLGRESEDEKQELLSECRQDGPSLGVDSDREPELSIPQRRQRLLDILFEPFAQGTAGFVQEARLLSQVDWSFRLEEVKEPRVLLWHGSKDVDAPIEMIRWMVERLPNARLEEFEDDTHFTIHQHLDEVLDDLITESKLLGGVGDGAVRRGL